MFPCSESVASTPAFSTFKARDEPLSKASIINLPLGAGVVTPAVYSFINATLVVASPLPSVVFIRGRRSELEG